MNSKICIVDHDLASRGYLRECLEREGHLLTILDNGFQIKSHLSQEIFDVVILNVDSPGVREKNLLIEIKKVQRPRILLIVSEKGDALFKGSPLMLPGTGIKVGDQLREVKLTDRDLAVVNIAHTAGSGKVRIISVVPSLDTKVCEQQTHQLSEKNHGLDKMVELITISIDTPFAQKRFATEAKITNVTFLSDYRSADSGKTHGLFLRDPHFLARAVMVVDTHTVIRYLQITPELAQLPDLEEAFKFARSLVTAS